MIYNPNTSSGSVLLNMLGDMLSAALTKEIELGRQCNEEAIGDMPAGGYSPVFVRTVTKMREARSSAPPSFDEKQFGEP